MGAAHGMSPGGTLFQIPLLLSWTALVGEGRTLSLTGPRFQASHTFLFGSHFSQRVRGIQIGNI
jgi:hypothetical protein